MFKISKYSFKIVKKYLKQKINYFATLGLIKTVTAVALDFRGRMKNVSTIFQFCNSLPH